MRVSPQKLAPAVLIIAAAAGTFAPAGAAWLSADGPVIEGIVLNHLGGGISEAQVRVETLDARPEDLPLAAATTDQLGDFLIRLPESTRAPVRIRITKRGYLEYVMVVDATNPDDPPYVDVTMEGAGSLSGTVRAEATGLPVDGAEMYCENSGRTIHATSDGSGRFRFEGVARGTAVVRVVADGFAISRILIDIDEDDARVDLEVAPELRLELLVVTDRNEPAPDVLVEALAEASNSYLTATTDADGKAVIRGMAADAPAVRFRLSGEGYVQESGYGEPVPLSGEMQPANGSDQTDAGPVPGDAGQTPLVVSGSDAGAVFRHRLVVKLAGAVRGKVVDARTGEPVVGIRVISGREVRSNMPMIWTAIDGTYDLSGLNPGTNVLSYQRNGYATAIREAQVTAGQTATQDVRLDAGQAIGGTVVNDLGKPLEQVWVTAEQWQGYRTLGLRTITGDDGAFLFPNAPPGEIEFSFVLAGHATLRSHVLETGRTNHRIVLPASAPAATARREVFESQIKVGEAVPDLSLTAPDGTVYKLSALRGKYVFLDFWASWCGPCIAEIPHVKALHEATKNQADFLLIGVSLDQDEAAFRRVVTDKQMSWPQVVGPRSGAEEAFETLGGFGIPYTCLIGPDGKLLAQHLRGPQMLEEVRKHVGEREPP